MDIEQTVWIRTQQTTRRISSWLAPWACFWAFFLWAWRVRDIFRNIPAYGDVLEVVWGILWYRESLFVRHVSPLFTPLVFHPAGWHTATLAHTPVFFLTALPLQALGGPAFAYNALAILSLLVAFAGAFRFTRLFTSSFAATLAAIVFTFMHFHWLRSIGGHLHISWASGLLPWLAWGVEQAHRTSPPRMLGKWTLLSGAVWGAMINASLYSLFLGALVFVLWGRQAFSLRRIKQMMLIGCLALLIALPTIGLYVLGSQQDAPHFFGIAHDLGWGASLNSLWVPALTHPIDYVRRISESLYTGPDDESGKSNLGSVTWLLVMMGTVIAIKTKPRYLNLAWLMCIALLLSLGVLLKWNGQVIKAPLLRPLNAALWSLGHGLKPQVFTTVEPEPPFRGGFPLPGLVLTALVPYWESARTVSRYAFVGALGAVVLAAYGLQHLPKTARYLLVAIWLIETLPRPSDNLPMPLEPHPAYAWLAEQQLGPGVGIADMESPTIKIDGDIIYATWLHGKPTAAGVGSFWPQHAFILWDYFLGDEKALSNSEASLVLQQYQVRYLFLHMKGPKEKEQWSQVIANPAFHPVQCFESQPEPSPWPYPICVARVTYTPVNLILREGWSGAEDWGVWAEGDMARAQWLVPTPQDYGLQLQAFPFCVPDQQQGLLIRVNGQAIAAHTWETCKDWQGQVTLPADSVRVGWNDITFEFKHSARPIDLDAENSDMRRLSMGFTELTISKR